VAKAVQLVSDFVETIVEHVRSFNHVISKRAMYTQQTAKRPHTFTAV
jgi:hypothetical protein